MDNVKVAVIGSGLMGGGIAQACAQAGFTVVNIDIAQAPLDKAQALVAKLLQKKVDKNKMSAEDRQAILDRLTYSTDYAELAGAKFIIEAVPERLDFKQSTFQKMDEFADEDAVLLTNTSGISIDEIAASTKRPESVLGLHFFYPAPVMKLVEIIRGEKTSDEAFAKTHEFADAIGKTSVDAPNTPGFIVNRVINPYENMGAWLVSEGVSAKDVDTAMKLACNHPMGPLELADMVGLDILLNVMTVLSHEYGEKYHPSLLLRKMVTAGFLGRKSGAGFYIYEDGKKVGVNPVLQREHHFSEEH